MEDLSQELLVENSFINVQFQENKAGEITVGGILDINLLDSHSKDDNDNLFSFDITTLLKFNTLHFPLS